MLKSQKGSIHYYTPRAPATAIKYSEQKVFFPGDIQQLGALADGTLNILSCHLCLCDISVVCQRLTQGSPSVFNWAILPSSANNLLNSFSPLIEFKSSGNPIFQQISSAKVCPFKWLLQTFMDQYDSTQEIDFIRNLNAILIGFSKGCTVINQCLMLMCEKCSSKAEDCCFNIKKIVLLDSGHNGSHTFYPVSVIPQLQRMGVKIEIWISPFQMRPERNGEVKQKEIDLLSEGLPGAVSVTRCRWKDKPSLDVHFQVLEEYLQSLKSTIK